MLSYNTPTSHPGGSQDPSSQTVQPSSFLQTRSIEEIITKWTQDLDAHLREFRSQALTISQADDALIAQGRKIAGLYKDTISIEGLTKELTLNLDYLECQQTELEQALTRVEAELSKYYENPPQLLASDIERDKLFTIAESCGLEISKLEESVGNTSQEINNYLSKLINENDPKSDLLKIIEAQLSVHNWATDAIASIKKRIGELAP